MGIGIRAVTVAALLALVFVGAYPATAAPKPAKKVPDVKSATVLYVVDGETLAVLIDGQNKRVKVSGTPKSGESASADSASKQALRERFPSTAKVTLTIIETEADGRIVATVEPTAKPAEAITPPKDPERPTAQPTTRNKPSEKASPWADFRGIKWATQINDLPGMILLQDAGDSKYYSRENEKLTIGEAELQDIIYAFYKGRLFGVRIEAKGFTNWTRIQAAVFAAYGRGRQPNEYIDEWYWGSPFPGVKDVRGILKYNEFSEETTFALYYNPILEQEKADEARKAKEAAKQDF